jgi:hypothetical protein
VKNLHVNSKIYNVYHKNSKYYLVVMNMAS